MTEQMMRRSRVILRLRFPLLALFLILSGPVQVCSAAEGPLLQATHPFQEAVAESVVIDKPSRAQGDLLPQPPQLSPEEQQRLEQAVERTHLPGPRPSPSRDAAAIFDAVGPSVPATGEAASPVEKAMGAAPLAPGTFTFLQNVDLGAGAPSGYTSVVGEPSVGNNGTALPDRQLVRRFVHRRRADLQLRESVYDFFPP